MQQPMTNEDFEKWHRLPRHIISRHYQWATRRKGPQNFPRRIEPDDLLQEANLALMDAWSHYDEDRGNQFSTYAYAVIHKRLWKYVNGCLNDENSYVTYFSEIEAASPFSSKIELGMVESDEDNVDEREFVKVCLEKLSGRLTAKEYRFLERRYIKGWAFKRIATFMGKTAEHARNINSEILVKAAVALLEEIDVEKINERNNAGQEPQGSG